MNALEILNEMARLDGERPFTSADMGNESEVLFRSLSDARGAFEFTDEIKNKISIQVAETNVPAEWTEMINAYPETQSFGEVQDQKGPTLIARILAGLVASQGDAPIGLQASSVQAASLSLGNDSSSGDEIDGLMSELKQREQERCSDSQLESQKGEDLDQVPACSEEVVEP